MLVEWRHGVSLVGDLAPLGEWADELVAVTTEQGFPYWRAGGTMFAAGSRSRKAM